MQTNINKPDSDKDVLLKMVDIEKSFPGVKALDHAQLTVRRGTVHALMGENGAGKSTLMKCLFGVYSKDGGHIYVDGQEVNYKNSKEALENGVAMVHQELNQALKRNVMDNMWLGRFPTVSKLLPFHFQKRRADGKFPPATYPKTGIFPKAWLFCCDCPSTNSSALET